MGSGRKVLFIIGVFFIVLGIASVTEEVHGCLMCPLDGLLWLMGLTSGQAFGFLEKIWWHLIVIGLSITLISLFHNTNILISILKAIRFRKLKIKSWRRRRMYIHILVFGLITLHITMTILGKTELKSLCPRSFGELIMHGQLGTAAIFWFFILLMVFVWGRGLCGWLCVFAPIQEQSANLLKACGVNPSKRKYKPSPILSITTFLLWTSLLYQAIRNVNNFDFHPYHGQTVASYWVFFGGAITAIPFALFFTYFLGSRFFCKYVCPVGGFQGYYSKLSLLKIKIDRSKCNDCSACSHACQMGVDISSYTQRKDPSIRDKSCILCGDCIDSCKQGALSFGWEGLFNKDRGNQGAVAHLSDKNG